MTIKERVMNTHNHHRIIKEFAKKQNLAESSDEYKCLIEASNFTDDLAGESNLSSDNSALLTQKNYFFFHYYYDIECNGDTIVLNRSKHNESRYQASMRKCEYNESDFKRNPNDYDYMLLITELTDSPINYKKFYNTINDRESFRETYFNKYVNVKPEKGKGIMALLEHKVKSKKLDSANQSDCVAFLHAMSAYEESDTSAMDAFRNHLINCFAEYLFLQDTKEAMYMLGIAFHGIMDSFTPSHTGFKNYVKQDMALHSQGDVIVFEGDSTEFSPGQFEDDLKASGGKTFIPSIIKGYNGDDHVNNTEFEMLKVYLKCFMDIGNGTTANKLLNGEMEFPGKNVLTGKPVNRSKKELNKILKAEVRFSPTAVNYSKNALEVLSNLYTDLAEKRKKCTNNYENYKQAKKELANILKGKWDPLYNAIQETQKDANNQVMYLGSKKETYLYARAQGDEDVDINSLEDFICDSANDIAKLVYNLKNSNAGKYIQDVFLDKISAAAGQISSLMGNSSPEANQAVQAGTEKLASKCEKVLTKTQEIISSADGALADLAEHAVENKPKVDAALGTAKKFCGTIKGMATDIKDATKTIQNNLGEYAKKLTDTVDNTATKASSLVEKARTNVTNFSQNITQMATDKVDEFNKKVTGGCEKVQGAAKTIIVVTNFAQTKLGGLVPPSVFDKIRGCANTINDTAEVSKNYVNDVTGEVDEKLKEGNELVKKKAQEIAKSANDVVEKVKTKANGYINSAKDQAEKWLQSAQDYCETVIKEVQDIENTIDGIQTTVDDYMNILNSLAGNTQDQPGQAGQVSGAADSAGEQDGLLGDVNKWLDSTGKKFSESVKEKTTSLDDKINTTLDSVQKTVGEKVDSATDQIGGHIDDLFGSLGTSGEIGGGNTPGQGGGQNAELANAVNESSENVNGI